MSDLKNYHILIVEDEYLSSSFLCGVINKLGFKNISIVTSAQAAIDLVKNKKVDIAFMDINIDGSIDGIVCARLINQEYPIPIIYITAYRDTFTIEEAGQTNIYGYLIKPFDEKDIEATLSVAIKRAQNKNKKNTKEKENSEINLGNSHIYCLDSKTLFLENEPIKLTKRESEVLYLLCKNINQNISYEIFREYIWEDKVVADSTIRDTILRLRKKVPNIDLENSIGLGYSLKRA